MNTNQPEKSKIRFRFDTHGLGDCCHAATVLQLYKQAGYDIAIQVEANKRWMWEACGIPIYDGPDTLPLHPYHYPHRPAWPYDFWDLSSPDHLASKIAHLVQGVGENVLPRLGTPEEMWRMISEAHPDIRPAISSEAHEAARDFLEGLPRPIFAIHSRGTNWSAEKSIPDGVAFETIILLLRQTKGSVIVLDFDARAPSLAGHPRCRAILPDGGIDNLDRLAALLSRIDLLIGIDSGPFHFGPMIPGLKMLGVFRKIPAPRCCIPCPTATYLVPGKDHIHWQRRLDASINIPAHDASAIPEPHFNFIEYPGDEPTATQIAETAMECLIPSQDSAMLNTSPSLVEFNEQLQAVPGNWLYRRMGSDERRLQLMAGGLIGHGAARCERKWRLINDPDGKIYKPFLCIYGDDMSETCRLKLGDDGIYRGRWNDHERMPIELIPIPEVCPGYDLYNRGQVIWNAAQAADSFPGYQPGWGVAVGSRGNGAAWLLDPAVQRSDLDSCGLDVNGAIVAHVDHEDWILKHLDTPAGSVCLDLASFIGTNAVWWANRGSIVIACEPMPRSRDLLHKNIELNQVGDRVTVIPKAFGTTPGKMRMQSELHYASFIGETGDVEVDVTTVDIELLPELQRLDVIKLDVEGAECEVIEGAMETLKRFRPKLVIEVHSHMDGRHDNGTILRQQLEGLGYKLTQIWTNIPTYYYLEAAWHG